MACVAALAMLSPCALAQVPDPAAPTAAAPVPTPELPSPAGAVPAYHTLDGWIRAWKVPVEPQAADPAGARGAMVTLRLAGRVMGRGAHISDDGFALWRAARDAWTAADAAMPFDKDALRDRNIADAAERMLIEVQFAGRLTPLLGETYAAATGGLSPGLHGVAARVGDRIEAIFPGTALATGAEPDEALRAAVGKLGLAPMELGRLTSSSGLVVYRFDARSLAQVAPGAQPLFTYRGGRVLHMPQVTGPALRSAADAIAARLLSAQWPGPEPHGLLGDYNPLTDSYDPLIAPPFAQALAAMALVEYARAPGVEGAAAERALAHAAKALGELTRVSPQEQDPLLDPLSAAMWLIAHRTLEDAGRAGAPESEPFARAALERLAATFDASRRAWTSAAPRAGRGLLAHALVVESMRAGAPPELRASAESAVRSVFRETDRSALVSELPWIGWAELALAEGAASVPAGEALRAVRTATWSAQVSERDAGTDFADMAGGIVFTRSRTPLPTWHTLRPVAFFASALGDPRLTSDSELRAEALALRRSLRFVLQLVVGESNEWLFRDPTRARGGVRVALWDQTCSLEASSLALLTIARTLTATEARSAAPPPPMAPTEQPDIHDAGKDEEPAGGR